MKSELDLDALEAGARRQAVPDAAWMNATNVLALIQRLREAEAKNLTWLDEQNKVANYWREREYERDLRIAQLERVRKAAAEIDGWGTSFDGSMPAAERTAWLNLRAALADVEEPVKS